MEGEAINLLYCSVISGRRCHHMIKIAADRRMVGVTSSSAIAELHSPWAVGTEIILIMVSFFIMIEIIINDSISDCSLST